MRSEHEIKLRVAFYANLFFGLLRSGYENATLISVGCPVQLIGEIFCVDTHSPRFEELAYILPRFDAVTCLVIRSYLRKAFLII